MFALEDTTEQGRDDGEFSRANDLRGIVGGLDESGTQSHVDAIQEIASLWDRIILIRATSHIYLSDIPCNDAVNHHFEIIHRHAPETGEVVGDAIGDIGKGKILGQSVTALHDGIDGTIEGTIATHHHNGAVAVSTHHLRQTLHGFRRLRLQEVILHALLLHILTDQLPTLLRLVKA